MNIICATDNNYVQHCVVMLKSLLINNSNVELDIYVLSENLSQENIDILKRTSNSKLHKINFLFIRLEDLKDCPIREGDHVSIATYYRLLAPLLINKIDKALYLDCDIIVCGSISDLYNIDINNYAIAAATDEDYSSLSKFERLSYNPQLGYFNAGVLLINMKYWRENNISEKCIDYIKENPEKCLFHDQDAMNKILCKCKKEIDIKYNFQTGFILANEFRKINCKNLSDKINDVASKNSYVVIHYTGYNKPWKASRHPYRHLYKYYRNFTIYKNIKIPECKLSTKERIYNLLAKLGLVKKVNSYIVDDYLKV